MTSNVSFRPNRRNFLLGSAAALATVSGTVLPMPFAHRALAATPGTVGGGDIVLRPSAVRANLVGDASRETAVWTYNGTVPGPEIRARQGQALRVRLENDLNQPTSIHWHGLRVPNAMDGVPGVTQDAVAPGNAFDYAFDLPDAGTYWYHPHANSTEQLGRGLYGALIVEEADPIRVDREWVWILDDWRLEDDAAIDGAFNAMHDVGHAGRLGNVVTVNGRPAEKMSVRPGERVRLRLLNAANGRIFALDFAGLAPSVIAMDGHPVPPHVPDDRLLLIGPGMRMDLVIDIPVDAIGRDFVLIDRFYEGLENTIATLAVAGAPLRSAVPDWNIALSANPVPEPDLHNAIEHHLVYSGGMMGGAVLRQLVQAGRISPEMLKLIVGDAINMGGMGGMMSGMFSSGNVWAVNGRDPDRDGDGPLVTVNRGQTVRLRLTNATAWHHPIHLHGHAFRVLARNDAATPYRAWQDTVMIAPGEQVDIAFVADNPGDWLIHCHILEHKVGGMSGVVRVV